MINIFYSFDLTFRPKNIEYNLFSKIVPGNLFDRPLFFIYNNFPLPRFYMKSLYRLLAHNSSFWGHRTFLMGAYSKTGWWYYFPAVILLKTPLLTLIMVFLFLIEIVRKGWLKKDEIIYSSFVLIL
jgi:hypothetical protein